MSFAEVAFVAGWAVAIIGAIGMSLWIIRDAERAPQEPETGDGRE